MLHSSAFSMHTSHWNKALIRGTVAALVVCAALVLTLLAAPPKTVYAAAITVNSLADSTTPGDGICTLREAINNANSDSNTAGGDCVTGSGADTITFSVSGTITLGSTLPNITTPVAINGTGQTVVVSGNNTVRVLYVESTGNLMLNTITVQNGRMTGSGNLGGGIYNAGTVTVTNSTLSGNSADYGGGGIANYFGTLTVTNSTLSGNSANTYEGGGIYNYYGTVTVTGSTFSDNSAGNGGAISSNNTMTIANSVFSDNVASALEGAIRSWSGTANITNSTFSGNSAPQGGGIGVYGGALNIKNSTFSGNSATAMCGAIAVISYRPALGNFGGIATITNSTFSGNSAGNDGGGLCILWTTGNGVATITNSTFVGNSAGSGGGGNIANYGGTVYLASTLLDTGTSGANCYTINSGTTNDNGYNLSDDGSCSFTGTGSQNNTTPNLGALADNGGPTQTHLPRINSPAINRIPNGTTITNNGTSYTCNQTGEPLDSDQRGQPRPVTTGGGCDAGAVEAADNICPTPSSITTADGLDACIQWANATAGPQTLGLGADITLSAELPHIASEITLNGSGHFVSGNNAVRVLYVESAGNLMLDTITVQNGRMTGSGNLGGGIYNAGTVTVTNSTLSGNSADYGGGGIANYCGTLTVTNSTLSGNSANTYEGGGIYNYYGTVTVTGSTLSDNSAGNGGAISSNNTMTIANSVFSDNVASALEGAIRSWSGTANITNSTFSGNSASQGGGIGVYGGALNIKNSTFSGNSATAMCGAIAVISYRPALGNFGGIATITNSTFSGNSAANDGGGLCILWTTGNGVATITNSTFVGNSAGSGGGGNIANYGGTVYLASTLLDTGTSGANCYTINSGTTNDNGYNLSDDGSCSFTGTGSQNNATPTLGALAGNGGPTQTHLPLLGSPAIDAIPNGTNGCGTTIITDQRGEARPFDGDGNGTETCDIGAVERRTAAPNFSINDVSAVEGNSGATTFTFTVTRTGATDGISAVQYATENGTATSADNDYVATSGTLTFDNGVTTQTVNVTVNGDNIAEPDETFFVNLSGATFASISDNQGQGTITNNDTAGITVNPTSGLVTTEAGGTATFTVVLTSQPTADVTIGLSSSDTTEGTVSPASLTFTSGNWNVAQTATVTGVSDLLEDGDVLYTILTAPAASGAPYYNTFNADDVSVTNLDNHKPVAVDDSYTADEDQTLTIAAPGVLGNDSDADSNPLTAVKDTDPAHGTLTLNADGSFTYTPALHYFGSDSFTYHASDGIASSNVATVSISIVEIPAPTAPALVSPENETLTNNNRPTFTWNAVTYGVTYQIQIDDTPDFSSTVRDETVAGTQYTSTVTLTDWTTYSWRVRAFNVNGVSGPWSTGSLTIDINRLRTPLLALPKDRSNTPDQTPTLSWGAVSGAKAYQVQWSSDPLLAGAPEVQVTTLTYTRAGTALRGLLLAGAGAGCRLALERLEPDPHADHHPALDAHQRAAPDRYNTHVRVESGDGCQRIPPGSVR